MIRDLLMKSAKVDTIFVNIVNRIISVFVKATNRLGSREMA